MRMISCVFRLLCCAVLWFGVVWGEMDALRCGCCGCCALCLVCLVCLVSCVEGVDGLRCYHLDIAISSRPVEERSLEERSLEETSLRKEI